MRAPRFTIVMNVCNGERFLAEALSSAFAQTCGDWELIFWDDASTDASAEVLRGFPADARVRSFRTAERVPLSAARELAIAQARGEWLAFLDQDDVWTHDKLEKQSRLIDRGGGLLAIVYGRAMRFGEGIAPRDFDHWHEFGRLPEGDIFASLFADSCYICQSTACLRTAAVRAAGPAPAGFTCCHDYFLYTELARHHVAAAVQDVVCWYRMHPAAMSHSHYNQVQREAIAMAERWRDHLDPPVLRRRLAIQHTMLGLAEFTSGEARAAGIARVLRQGSLPYLLSRPFARGLRAVRRAARRATAGSPTPPAPT